MTLWNMIQRRLGWKLFLSYLMVVIIGGAVLIATAQLHTSTVMVRHIARFDNSIGDDLALKEEIAKSFMLAIDEVIIVAATVAFLSALILSNYVARRIIVPVQQMMHASQRIAAGKYRERVPVTGNDELAELAYSFNHMASIMEETDQRRVELIGNVAHELRTPLSSIQVIIEGLSDGVLPVDPTTYVEVQREIKRLQRLVYDLQELSRVETTLVKLNLTQEDVGVLVHSVADQLRPQFEDKTVGLVLDLADGLPLVPIDADRIIQVLVNLIGNALHYTPAGGQVSVRLEQDGASRVCVQIQDTGIGIPSEHLPHIFERFYRVDKSRSRVGGGSGVGLTIAKHLVEAHRGTLSAASPGCNQGSTFTFTIPIY